MIQNSCGKNITTDLTSGDVDFEANRDAGTTGYGFFPTGIIISPSAEDAVELKNFKCELFGSNAILTLILECGKIHDIPVKKVFKTGTTTNVINVVGNPM